MGENTNDIEMYEKYDPEEREREERERLERERIERERERIEAERKERERQEREARERRERRRQERRAAISLWFDDFSEIAKRIAIVSAVILLVGAIIFGIVFGIISAIRGISGAVRARREEKAAIYDSKYSAENISFFRTEKSSFSTRMDYNIQNNSILDITYFRGDLKAYNLDGEIVYETSLYYNGEVKAGGIGDLFVEFQGDYKNYFYDSPISQLKITYDIKEITYSDGETKEYTDSLHILSEPKVTDSGDIRYSRDNLEFTVTSKDEYSATLHHKVENVGEIGIKYYVATMYAYNTSGELLSETYFSFSGGVDAGRSKSLTLDLNYDYYDYYYATLDELIITISIEKIEFADGYTKRYEPYERQIFRSASNEENAA